MLANGSIGNETGVEAAAFDTVFHRARQELWLLRGMCERREARLIKEARDAMVVPHNQ